MKVEQLLNAFLMSELNDRADNNMSLLIYCPNQKNLQRDSATRAKAENIATIFNEPTFQSRVISDIAGG